MDKKLDRLQSHSECRDKHFC